MVQTGSLASPAIRGWNRALIRDTFDAYPDIDGVRLDWPEYPCYYLSEVFYDFGEHAERWAAEHGFDVETMRRDTGDFARYLHGSLKNSDLSDWASEERGTFLAASLLIKYPGVTEWLRCKAQLCEDLLVDWREAIACYGGKTKELMASAFAPPFSIFTGFDYTRASKICNSVNPKMYAMHWSMMVEDWARELVEANPALDEGLVVRSLASIFDLAENNIELTIDNFGYPSPDAAHPVSSEVQARKIQQVVRASAGRAAVYPILHGYGPVGDFERRLRLVESSPADGVMIQRYGYLSDDKLDAIGRIWSNR
jgi:hypothetical protein